MSDMTHTPAGRDDTSKHTWMRGLFMLVFIVLFELAKVALSLIAILQFFWLLFTKAPNASVRKFGVSLGNWMLEVADFQACATDDKPFPWKPWPASDE